MVCRSDRHESGGGRPLIHSGGHREASVGFGWNLFNRTEDPTMTEEMMSLRTLLEKSADADQARQRAILDVRFGDGVRYRESPRCSAHTKSHTDEPIDVRC